MAVMRGRRGVDRRFKMRGTHSEADEMQTADVVVGDGSEDGTGDSILEVHIGITL